MALKYRDLWLKEINTISEQGTHQEKRKGDTTVNQSCIVPSFVEKYAQEQCKNYPEIESHAKYVNMLWGRQ
jgi:hypothetical protein